MAKNYSFSEFVNVIHEGKDLNAISDIGRRYPVLALMVAGINAKAGDEFAELVKFMPDFLTANKINMAIKATIPAEATTSDEEDGIEEPAEIPTATEGEVMPDYSSMSGKNLWEILGNAGARKTAKSTKKVDLVEACEKLWNKTHNNTNEEEQEAVEAPQEAQEDASEESDNPYAGKNAMELFKLCKKRGIKAKPKQKAKYYVDLLMAADAKTTEEEEPEEEETKKPEKKEKPAKKAKKEEPVVTTEDDDDWDI